MDTHEQNDHWEVFLYEVQMYCAMIRIREEIGKGESWNIVINQLTPTIVTPKTKKINLLDQQGLTSVMNAFIESKLLHIHVLSDILLEKGSKPDDIKLSNLLPDWKSDRDLEDFVKNLGKAYGNSQDINTPCWIINKMMAHGTAFRTSSFNYQKLFLTMDNPLKVCIKRVAVLGKKVDIVHLISSII